MNEPIPTFDALLEHMQTVFPGVTVGLRADTPRGQFNPFNIPAEVAVFVTPIMVSGCMVWGRTDRGWHPNHGEQVAISILLAKMKEQA